MNKLAVSVLVTAAAGNIATVSSFSKIPNSEVIFVKSNDKNHLLDTKFDFINIEENVDEILKKLDKEYSYKLTIMDDDPGYYYVELAKGNKMSIDEYLDDIDLLNDYVIDNNLKIVFCVGD